MNDAWIGYILKRMEMAEDWDGIDDREIGDLLRDRDALVGRTFREFSRTDWTMVGQSAVLWGG